MKLEKVAEWRKSPDSNSILFFIVMLAIRKIQTVFFVNAHKLFYGIIVAICILGLVFHLTRTEWHLPELAVMYGSCNKDLLAAKLMYRGC